MDPAAAAAAAAAAGAQPPVVAGAGNPPAPPAPPAAPQPPPVAPAVVPFALSPAMAANAIVDYTTPTGQKLYKAAIAPLENKFDGSYDKVLLFLRNVEQHVIEQNLTGILTVIDAAGNPRFLLHHYGTLTEANVRDHSATFMTGQNNRDTQRSDLLYQFLYHSIGDTLRMKVTNDPNRYSFYGLGGPVPDGPLFLKVIISHAHIDTVSTTANIQLKLTSLDDYVRANPKTSIPDFNTYVKSLLTALSHRGGTVDNLLTYLLRGYSAVSDTAFVTFMTTVQNGIYYQGHLYTPYQLMDVAEQFWSDRQARGLWTKPSAEEEQILALSSEIKNLEAKNQDMAKKFATKNKGDGDKKKDKKGKKDGDKKKKKKKDGDKTWAWKDIAPKDGEPLKKTFRDKEYHWCPHHDAWTVHTASECNKNKHKSDTSGLKLQVQKALQAIVEEDFGDN